jgi:hypothetical protein
MVPDAASADQAIWRGDRSIMPGPGLLSPTTDFPPRSFGPDGIMRGGTPIDWEGVPPWGESEVSPEDGSSPAGSFRRGWSYPERPFRRLLKPRRRMRPSEPLVVAVGAIRLAGWFQDWSASTEELAATLSHTWRERHDGDLDLLDYPELLDQCILAMDDQRSTYESARPDVDEVNLIYTDLVPLLARLVGLKPTRVKEVWSQDLTEAEVSFKLDNSPRSIVVSYCDRYISPRLITSFNAVIPPGNLRRLWFPDNPITEKLIVTAATEHERAELERLRPIQLMSTPPGWWSEIDPD